MENNTNSRKNTLLIPLVILAAIALILAVVLVIKLPQLKEVQRGLEMEKEQLTEELTDLSDSYSNLKTENDTLNARILIEQEKITTLLDKMREFRNNSYAEINRYKKEIGTLKGVLRSYVVQVDSLNRVNTELRAENKEVKKQISWVRERNTRLERESSQLKDVVEKASVLKARELTVTPINSRNGRRIDWKRCGQLKAEFVVEKNVTAKRGARTIYLRIVNPAGVVIASDGSKFRFQNAKLEYSAKREIQYEGEALETAIYCINDGKLTKGQYSVQIFSNDEIMAESEFIFN